jgi:hypothetical protein
MLLVSPFPRSYHRDEVRDNLNVQARGVIRETPDRSFLVMPLWLPTLRSLPKSIKPISSTIKNQLYISHYFNKELDPVGDCDGGQHPESESKGVSEISIHWGFRALTPPATGTPLPSGDTLKEEQRTLGTFRD